MATKYRLKAGVGTHRRPSVDGKLGRKVEYGELFEPTPNELRSFAHKFEVVDTASLPASDARDPRPKDNTSDVPDRPAKSKT